MKCHHCKGSGWLTGGAMTANPCQVCNGSGDADGMPLATINKKSLFVDEFPKQSHANDKRCDACTDYFANEGDVSSTVEIRAGAIWRVKMTLCLSCQRGIKSVFSNYIHSLRGANTDPIFEDESPEKGGRNLIL